MPTITNDNIDISTTNAKIWESDINSYTQVLVAQALYQFNIVTAQLPISLELPGLNSTKMDLHYGANPTFLELFHSDSTSTVMSAAFPGVTLAFLKVSPLFQIIYNNKIKCFFHLRKTKSVQMIHTFIWCKEPLHILSARLTSN